MRKSVFLLGTALVGSSVIYSFAQEDRKKPVRKQHDVVKRHDRVTDKPAAGQPGNRQTYRPMFQWLGKEHPEMVKKLKEMKEKNPEQYKAHLKGLMKRFEMGKREKMGKHDRRGFDRQKHEAMRKEHEEIRKLVGAYNEGCRSDEVKEKIRAKLNDQLEKQLQKDEEGFKKMEEHYLKIKDRIEKRRSQKKQMVEDKLNQLTKDPDLKW